MTVFVLRQRHIHLTLSVVLYVLLANVTAFQRAQDQTASRSLRLRHSSIAATTSLLSLRLSSEDATHAKSNGHHKSPKLPPCYYKRADGSWKPRKNIESLFIGERLFGSRLPNSDLLDGKTGPKVFLECGIGRVDSRGRWQISNGMMRLGKKNGKFKVIRKQMKKLPTESLVEVYVSRISLYNGCFEVCASLEKAIECHEKRQDNKRISASSLKVGEEFSGEVVRVYPYGVIVDVGANRNGLLHISDVAKHLNSYVNKEEGLKKAGLYKAASIQVVVSSNEQKRVMFVLPTKAVDENSGGEIDALSKMDGGVDINSEENEHRDIYEQDSAELFDEVSEDEAAAWAAYAANDIERSTDDEEKDIEDRLGIGYY